MKSPIAFMKSSTLTLIPLIMKIDNVYLFGLQSSWVKILVALRKKEYC